MGLVQVVVRVLAEDHGFDGVEGGVPGPIGGSGVSRPASEPSTRAERSESKSGRGKQ